MPSTIEKLADYIASALEQPLPPEVAEKTRFHVLDTIAAMVTGAKLGPGVAAIRYVRSQGGTPESLVIGSDVVTTAVNAAMANAMLAHADETDDSHAPSLTHPGCAIVPAALAMAERENASGESLLRAVTLGYDVGCRIARAMGGISARGMHGHATHSIGPMFGATATAAALAGLDAKGVRHALAYTSQQASGVTSWARDAEHVEKAFVFGGMPARSGVTSALLVQLGWNGIDDIFSGAHNFFDAYAPDPKPEVLIDGLGDRYEVMRTDIKKWSVGTPIQAPLDCLELARGKRPFEADDVQEVVVRLAPIVALVVDNRDIPDICLQHMVAVMLIDKTASFEAAHDKGRMQDATILRQRAKVRLVPDSTLDRFLPVRVAAVEVTLTDGTRLTEQVEAVRGTPRNPMSREEVVNKATDLIAPVLGDDKTTRLVETIFGIERLGSVRALGPLLQLG